MKVLLETNYGNITLELDHEAAPVTAANFEEYVRDGFYDGTIFHRVIDGFMVQGGGFNEDMTQRQTKATIKNEANNGLKNVTGTVAMARTGEPHSASSQFFINVSDNDFLNFKSESPQGWGYTVFAKVVDGMGVVEKIKAVSTGNRAGHQDVPNDNVCITQATICE